MTMSGTKKQHLSTQYFALSDDNDSSQELTETILLATSMSDGDDVHQIEVDPKVLAALEAFISVG